MMRTCTLFDQYRDGEIGRAEREGFEAHLAECADCRAKKALLDNLALILKRDTAAAMQVDLSGRIARKAFQQKSTWDALVIGWLRPGPAFVALALMCILFSALWLAPNSQPINMYSEYEMLMDKAEAIKLDISISRIQSDTELVAWLEQEARSR